MAVSANKAAVVGNRAASKAAEAGRARLGGADGKLDLNNKVGSWSLRWSNKS
jgi:hypothetical protein